MSTKKIIYYLPRVLAILFIIFGIALAIWTKNLIALPVIIPPFIIGILFVISGYGKSLSGFPPSRE